MPVSAASAGTQFLAGALQTIFSGKKKAERNLENYANSYNPNSSIMDAYNKALQRYSSNPYQSQFYQNANNNIQRNLATGIDATTSRRGGLATIGALTQGADDAAARAGVTAENMQGQQLGQLTNAARLAANEQEKKYDMIFNLKALKASAANQQQAAGEQNMFQAIGNAGNLYNAEENGTEGIGTGTRRRGGFYIR